ncbi:MAG: hypothetical protein ACI4Q9_05270 [Candidatus Methanomethylophilaceae archaeon]
MGSIFYIERNGNRYAYESISMRVPGKKNPRTVKTYLGKVDPVTGEIIPKRKENCGLSVRSYGAVMLMHGIQKELRLGEDLESAFEGYGREVLGTAIALAISPASFTNIPAIEEGTLLREINGHDIGLDRNNVDRILHKIGGSHGSIKRFFRLRAERNHGRTIAFGSDIKGHLGTYDSHTDDRTAGESYGLMVVTDTDGIPERYFVSDPGNIKGYDPLVLSGGSPERTDIVLHRRIRDVEDLSDIISSGTRFSALVSIDSDRLKRLVTVAAREMIQQDDGGELAHREYDLYVSDTDGSWNISPDASGSWTALKAFVIRDHTAARSEHERMSAYLEEIEERIRASTQSDANRLFSRISPSLRRCIDYTVSEDGTLQPVRRQNAITFARNRAGLYVVIASPDRTWDTIMSDYDTVIASDRMLGIFDDNVYIDGKGRNTRNGMIFVRFLSQILRMHLRKVLAENIPSDRRKDVPDNITVDSVLMHLGILYAVKDGGSWVCTEHGSTADRILSLLGYPVQHAGETVRLTFDGPEAVEDD